MRAFLNNNLQKLLEKRYIYLDNDFLSELFSNRESVFTQFMDVSVRGSLFIDIHTEFEFLRDVISPADRKNKENFLSLDIFAPTNNHPEVMTQIQANALILSKIYAHQHKSSGIGYVDLHLAARIMHLYSVSILITGNKKHYPCVFDTADVISIEQGDNTVQSYYVLTFNKKKFDDINSKLDKVK